MSDTTRSKLLHLVAELRSEKARVEKQFNAEIEKIDNDLQAVQRTIDLLSDGGTDIVEQSKSQLVFDLAILPLISDAKSQYEALKIIGRQNLDGMVNMTKAADMLIRAGRAKGKRRNLVITIYNYFKNSDEWVWVSPGNFRLIEK